MAMLAFKFVNFVAVDRTGTGTCTDLVSIWYVDGLSALGHMPRDSGAPCHAHLFLLLHFLHRAPGAHVEQLRDEASAIGEGMGEKRRE